MPRHGFDLKKNSVKYFMKKLDIIQQHGTAVAFPLRVLDVPKDIKIKRLNKELQYVSAGKN